MAMTWLTDQAGAATVVVVVVLLTACNVLLECRGPLMGKLKSGETVTLDSGAVVSNILQCYITLCIM